MNTFRTLAAGLATAGLALGQSTYIVSTDAAGVPGNHYGQWGTASFDGRWIAISADSTNLHPAMTNGSYQVFVKDQLTGAVDPISLSAGGVQGNDDSEYPRITNDGRFVIFTSKATNLTSPQLAPAPQVYVRDRWTGALTIESLGNGAFPWPVPVAFATISDDGRYVAWRSASGGLDHLYVRDRQTNLTVLVDQVGATVGNGDAGVLVFSADGRYAAFDTYASNLVAGDTNGELDVFVKDLLTGVVTRVSQTSLGLAGNQGSALRDLSADGRYVSFASLATDIVVPDLNGSVSDVLLHDRFTGLTGFVSLSATGQQANSSSDGGFVSWDGRYVAFGSYGDNLNPQDPDSELDYFVRDRLQQTTELASIDSQGNKVTGQLYVFDLMGIADNGRFVLMRTFEALAPTHPSGTQQIYVRERGLICITPYAYCTGKTNSLGCVPWAATFGCSSASADEGFYLLGGNVRNNKQGLLFYGVNGQAANPFQGGTMCVNAPRKRTPVTDSLGTPPPADDCSGLWVIDMNAFAAGLGGGGPIPALSVPGTIVDCQWWGRDPGAPFNTSLTNAVEYLVGL